MQYKVVYVQKRCMIEAVEELEKEVKLLLMSGWKLLGGISIARDSGMSYACQTMVK